MISKDLSFVNFALTCQFLKISCWTESGSGIFEDFHLSTEQKVNEKFPNSSFVVNQRKKLLCGRQVSSMAEKFTAKLIYVDWSASTEMRVWQMRFGGWG